MEVAGIQVPVLPQFNLVPVGTVLFFCDIRPVFTVTQMVLEKCTIHSLPFRVPVVDEGNLLAGPVPDRYDLEMKISKIIYWSTAHRS